MRRSMGGRRSSAACMALTALSPCGEATSVCDGGSRLFTTQAPGVNGKWALGGAARLETHLHPAHLHSVHLLHLIMTHTSVVRLTVAQDGDERLGAPHLCLYVCVASNDRSMGSRLIEKSKQAKRSKASKSIAFHLTGSDSRACKLGPLSLDDDDTTTRRLSLSRALSRASCFLLVACSCGRCFYCYCKLPRASQHTTNGFRGIALPPRFHFHRRRERRPAHFASLGLL